MAQTRNPKQQYYPRSNGMRRQERCMICRDWTPIGTAATKRDVFCAACAPRVAKAAN